jgi:glycyl-tRNA synthetase alpha subunit
MEVSRSSPISSRSAASNARRSAGELTYGLERLAMYVQGVDNVYDLNFNGREGADKVTYGDVFLQAEQEYSRHNFEHLPTPPCCTSAFHRRREGVPGASGRRCAR